MKKLPIGPIIIGMVLLGLIGGLLLLTKGPPPPAQDIAVVTVPGDTASPIALPATAAPVVAPSPSPSPLAPGQDPPARREPGAINYAEKGVLPAL
ncbi:MAG TPA: hypothetical protein VK980_08595 [Sphingomonas sp.]|nr:hypothetical protein [Sphingomonas sp.]